MRHISNRCQHTLLAGIFCWLAFGGQIALAADQNTAADPEALVATGVMKSVRTSMLGPVVPGVVDRIFVKVGDHVEAGQPLFRIRQHDYEIKQRKSKAALDLAIARTEVRRKQHSRVVELFETANISESALDESKAAVDVLAAEQVVAQAVLSAAEQALADTIVTAPYAGVITRKLVSEGVYKSMQAFGGNGGIVEIQEARFMVAILFMPVRQVSKLRLGQKVVLTIDGISTKYSGEIAVINHQAQTASNMLEFRVAITNDDFQIKDGQPVVAHITSAK